VAGHWPFLRRAGASDTPAGRWLMTAFLNFALLVLVLIVLFGIAALLGLGGIRLAERPARRRASRRSSRGPRSLIHRRRNR
jgi:hypothetical protein